MNTYQRTGKWSVKPQGGTGFKIEEFNGNANEDSDNQKLISAAPYMLEAIQYYVSVLDEVRTKSWREHPDHVDKKMLEALNKAIINN